MNPATVAHTEAGDAEDLYKDRSGPDSDDRLGADNPLGADAEAVHSIEGTSLVTMRH
ncbi:hypothetical protein [Actinomadura darangshiensis]|uniref:hypothetical protein n=1 Tax=Actinomadura darangshiensis TaxID=705336 RepID=UPI00140C2991|nr:hypothetical protein [Actinomadura darangshiensis]